MPSSSWSLSPNLEIPAHEDGSSTVFFGYMNANWLQEFDIPIGPENSIE